MSAESDPLADYEDGLRWVLAGLVAPSLRTAVELGVADLVAEGARTVPEIAAATGTHPPALQRVLRLLGAIGFLREDEVGRFHLTGLGGTLRTDGSLAEAALFYTDPALTETMADLGRSVVDGASAHRRLFGRSLYERFDEDHALGATFSSMLSKQARIHDRALLEAVDLSGVETVVDVGGGDGATLADVLHAYPSVRGVLIDRPTVTARARPLSEPALTGRCRVVAGDMFEDLPDGADCYLVKRVICDLDDDDAVRLLISCGDRGRAGARILVVDQTPTGPGDTGVGVLLDVLFLTVFGPGRVRGPEELAALCEQARLELVDVRDAGPNTVYELTRR